MEAMTLCLLFLVYFDTALLKRRDPVEFARIFITSKPLTGLGVFLIIATFFLSENRSEDVASLILAVWLPFYLLCRGRFKNRDSAYFSKDGWEKVGAVPTFLSSAVGVVVMWLYGMIAFEYFLTGLRALWPAALPELGELMASSVFSNGLAVTLIYQSSKSFSDRGFWVNVGFTKLDGRWARGVGAPAALGLFFALLAVFTLFTRQVPPPTPLGEVIESADSTVLILLFGILALGAAPLLEEIIFRGYFFHVFKEWLGPAKTIYIIAATFAALHVGQYWGDWTAIGIVALLGLAMTAVRAWAGTTMASVITHYVYNISVTVLPVVFLALTNPAYFKYTVNYERYDATVKEALLKESLARQPNFADAYDDLAFLYAEEKVHLEEALALAEAALELAPDHPVYLDTKAYVLEQLGRTADAEALRARPRP